MKRVLVLVLATALAACGSSPAKPTVPAPPTGSDTMTGSATTTATQPTPPPLDADHQPLPLWPEVTKGKLPNGLTYYMLKHDKPEKRAFLWLAVNAGSVLEDDDQRGLAHFVEHMAFNGTKRFPKNDDRQLPREDRHAVRRRPQRVHDVRRDRLPARGPDRQAGVRRQGPRHPARLGRRRRRFDPNEVEKERGVVLEEWRLGRGASARLFDKQAPVLFEGSRYADAHHDRRCPRSSRRRRATRSYRFYKDWYRPDLMAVIAVGDFDPAAIEKEIKARFGDLKNPANERARIARRRAEGRRHARLDRDRPASCRRPSVAIYNIVPHRARREPQTDYRRHRRRAALHDDPERAARDARAASPTRRSSAAFVRHPDARRARSTRSRAPRSVKAGQRRGRAARAAHRGRCASSATASRRRELERARTIAIARQLEEAADAEATTDSRDVHRARSSRNFLAARAR